MKNKKICKSFVTLGLLLFFTLLLPLTSFNTAIAKAASIEKETTDGYRLNLKSVTLVKGKSFALKVYNLGTNSKISFKSDDTEVASVNNDGTITANKVGQTIVTATIKDGNKKSNLSCEVIITPAAISVKWTKGRVFIGMNNEDILKVIIKPDNTIETAKFSSSDDTIASITSGGRLSAKKIGMTYVFAQIDATNQDGTPKCEICTVFVTSSTDVPFLEAYFNEHTELSRIPDEDLRIALDKFFNKGKASEAITTVNATESALVTELNSYLESEFKISEIRAKMKEEAEKALSNSSGQTK